MLNCLRFSVRAMRGKSTNFIRGHSKVPTMTTIAVGLPRLYTKIRMSNQNLSLLPQNIDFQEAMISEYRSDEFHFI